MVSASVDILRSWKLRILPRGIYMALSLGLLLFATAACLGQQYLGTIAGEVSDAGGARVKDAAVTVTDEQTHFVTKGKTNGAGSFSIPLLQPGTYTLHIEMPGFGAKEITGVVLTAGDNKQVNVSLAASENVNVSVTADRDILETGTANVSETFDTKEVTDLPSIGRNPFNLATAADGFYSDAFAQRRASGYSQPYGGISVNQYSNGLNSQGRLTLNGIPDDPAEATGRPYTGIVPSPEAVQEVKALTSLFDAQYGHGASFTNVVMRTGANAYHGAAYYIFQNTYLNSNSYDRTAAGLPRASNQWNQPGAVFDGPVRFPHLYNGKDKSFFLVAYERIQNNLPEPFTGTVPTAKMRTGDFSELLDASGNCPTGTTYTCLYDPTTNLGAGIRSPFAHNDLTAKISPLGKAFLNAYPLPNTTGTGLANLVNNYVARTISSPDLYYSIAARFDQQIGASNKLSIFYAKNSRHQTRRNAGFELGFGPGYNHHRDNEGGSADVVTVLTPKLVLDSRFGVVYHPFSVIYYGYNYDLAGLGFSPSLISQLPSQSTPAITVSDGANGLTGGASQLSGTTLLSATEILSQSISKHSLKYGIEYQMVRFNQNDPTSSLGTFAFNRKYSQRNGAASATSDTNSGFGLASLALGYASSGTQTTNTPSAYQQHYFGLYVQDDWRISKKLTLTLGVRYDYEEPLTERHNATNDGFCITCVSPLQVAGLPTLMGGLTFADANHRYPYKPDLDNFQPRLGFSYQLNNKQVLRGGFGIIYLQTLDQPGNSGFSSTTAYTASIDGFTPFTTLANPYPGGLNVPTGRSKGLGTLLGSNINFANPGHVVPKLYQAAFSIQTELPGQTRLEIGFAGNYARDLQLSKDINTLPSIYFGLGATELQRVVTNPLAGTIPSNSTLNAATIQRRFLLLPYPEFGTVTENYIHQGISNYSALRVQAVRRMTHSLSLHASFRWAKDMTSDFINDSDALPTYYQEPQPNLLFTMSSIYQLPKFSQKNYAERMLLGGWQVAGVFRAQNGTLIPSPTNVVQLRDPNIGSAQTYSKMFNTCYLTSAGAPSANCSVTDAAYQQESNSTYITQTVHPYMDHVRNIIKPRLDVSMFKVFALHEHTTFEIRGEFFNVTNGVNFTVPNTNPTALAYGSVTFTQQNDPRIGQLTARINF